MCPQRLCGKPVPLGGVSCPLCCERFTGWQTARPNPLRSVFKVPTDATARGGAALPLSPEGGSPRAA